MALTINDTPLIDKLDLWKANITSLPNINYSKLSYRETNKDLWVCQDTNIVKKIKLLFTKSVIDKKIFKPYSLLIQIFKNKPGFKLIPHFDNNTILGIHGKNLFIFKIILIIKK